MKYKVGDKVKIRSWSDMEQEFGLNENGNINVSGFSNFFTFYTKKWCGKAVTIKEVYPYHYEIKETEFAATDQMIDHTTTKTKQKS